MGWRGKDGSEHLRGAPNPKQWEMYAQNNCVFQYHLPEGMHYMRNWNRAYLDFAKDKGWRQKQRPGAAGAVLRHAADLSPRGAGQDAGPPAARAPARAHRHLLRPAALLVRAAGRSRHRPAGLSAERDHAAADGDVSLLGLAERLAAPDPQPQLPARQPAHRARPPASTTAAGAGSKAAGARCAACCATARRSSPARCGPGTRSARPTAPGSSRPAPTRRARASCSTT